MDKIDIYEDKLTPSAKEALRDTITELEALLLEKASLMAQREQTGDKEISLRDILTAKEMLFKVKFEAQQYENKRKRIMTVFTLTGALYALLGIGYYLYKNQALLLEKNIGLLMFLGGLSVIVGGLFYTQVLTKKQEAIRTLNPQEFLSNEDDFELIKKWQIIEKLGSNIMRQKGYTNNRSRSINEILKFFSTELEDKMVYLELRELLTIRNRILHEGYVLTKNERVSFVHNANKIISILEGMER